MATTHIEKHPLSSLLQNRNRQGNCPTCQNRNSYQEIKNISDSVVPILSFHSSTHCFLTHYTLYGHHQHMLNPNSLPNSTNHFSAQNPPPSPTPRTSFLFFHQVWLKFSLQRCIAHCCGGPGGGACSCSLAGGQRCCVGCS